MRNRSYVVVSAVVAVAVGVTLSVTNLANATDSAEPTPGPGDQATVGLNGPKGFPGKLTEKVNGNGSAKVKVAGASATYYYFYGTSKQVINTETVDGIAANLVVANPYVDTEKDLHSLAEIAVSNSGDTNTIEAGWMKDPVMYGDASPHRRGGASGCYNGCGWVDFADNPTDAGDVVKPGVSKQFYILHQTGAWWVFYDGSALGYYPDKYWNDIGEDFTFVTNARGYGEVAAGSSAPCTDMGDGLLPPDKSAAFVSSWNNHIVDGDWVKASIGAPQVLPRDTKTEAYSVLQSTATKFFYGGPGFC
jgi:hypothetical protein